jgi:magnesium-transporting ATPase (P-type)
MKEKNKKDAPCEGPLIQSWHAMSVDDVLVRMGLDSSVLSHGLTIAEAKERLEMFGPNKMTESTKKTLCQHIYDQVANLLVIILAVVAVVSAVRAATATDADTVITSTIQVGLIVGVIVINTIIGVWQEGSAEAAAEALRNMLSADACVMRDGKEVQIPSTEVVPGDHVIINSGDKVPADMRMFTVFNLACGEAALTGESVPIDKTVAAIAVKSKPESTPLGDRHNMAFSATLVAEGCGAGIAIATGDDTQIGTINALVSTVEEKKTNVLEQIDFISKWLAVFILMCTLTTFLIALLKTGIPAMDALSISLVCAVGMIPEGLAAIVTMTYAWAVSNMAKQNAIIRALPAVETLGSVTVICSDKTGTLTQNKMSVVAFVTSNAHYRVDVNAKVPSPDSFVRYDSYLSVRAGHLTDASLKAVVEDGPNTNLPRRGKVAPSNHFAITNLEKPPPSMHVAPSKADSDNLPVADGDSPDLQFIKSALAGGILCSQCVLGVDGTREGEIGNPTEISILRAAYNAGVDVEGLKEKNPIVAEVPFCSSYKFMSTIHEPMAEIDGEGFDGQYIVHVKGAPDSMLSLCSTQAMAGLIGEVEPIRRTYWTEQIAILSSHGLRVLALTRAVIPKSEVKAGDQLGPEFINRRADRQWLTMVGLCGIQDPPRPECIDAISTAHKAGVRVAMITGDHKDTAIAIGTILGLVDDLYPSGITGPELDEMDEEQLKEAVMTYNVFARSSPENKLQIVKALQAQQQVASMTGDGVNDAPSLKQADMGVAMGLEGTDVAREASDMILADDNFATIVVGK